MAVDVRLPQEPDAPRTVLAEDGALHAQGPDIDREDLLALYQAMRLARSFDMQLETLLRQGRLGFHLAGAGEEAVSAASAHVLGEADWLFPAFRDLAAYLVRGIPLATLAHQAFGSSRSPTLGHPLPLYSADAARHVATPGAGGAAHLPHAVGAAWAAKLRGDSAVALVSFNQGAVASGEFHAALNFAGVFQAPVVFVCRHQIHDEATTMASIAARAKGYGIAGSRVDGSDLLALIAALRAAIGRARAGEGPTLVEALLGGPWSRDPLILLRRHLTHRGDWDDTRDQQLATEQRLAIRGALREAAAACPPAPETIFQGVYSLHEMKHDADA
jgi:TPP-dependent pyruvate/acetoin dehydrogenase alpha subunit